MSQKVGFLGCVNDATPAVAVVARRAPPADCWYDAAVVDFCAAGVHAGGDNGFFIARSREVDAVVRLLVVAEIRGQLEPPADS